MAKVSVEHRIADKEKPVPRCIAEWSLATKKYDSGSVLELRLSTDGAKSWPVFRIYPDGSGHVAPVAIQSLLGTGHQITTERCSVALLDELGA